MAYPSCIISPVSAPDYAGRRCLLVKLLQLALLLFVCRDSWRSLVTKCLGPAPHALLAASAAALAPSELASRSNPWLVLPPIVLLACWPLHPLSKTLEVQPGYSCIYSVLLSQPTATLQSRVHDSCCVSANCEQIRVGSGTNKNVRI